jgi:cysteine desulfurase
MQEFYGNASSFHKLGIVSEKIIRETKNYILDFLNDSDGSFYFTSGGTESNNLAVFGANNIKNLKIILSSAIEHASAYNSIKYLENSGVKTKYLIPDSNFEISEPELENLISSDTDFISIMHVNNEAGMILPIEKISEIKNKKCPNAIFHVDAVQSFGKFFIDVKKLGIDLLSISAHKIHGPKGIGGLYASKKINLHPILFGGKQQNKIRPGTEPVELISGFKTAVKYASLNIQKNYEYIKKINNYAREKFSEVNGIIINSPVDASPYILNISVLGLKSEVLVNFLSENNIFVSSSSACTGNAKSHVLTAVNLPENRIESAIRMSFSIFNSVRDVDKLCDFVKKAQKNLII